MNRTASPSAAYVLPLILLAAGCVQSGPPDESSLSAGETLLVSEPTGFVFTQTNAAPGNELVVYGRAKDGTLSLVGQLATGGSGAGSQIPAQGAIARAGRFLLVVNAGSNDVSTFDTARGTPELVAVTPSGGVQPVSVSASGDWVYVLNAGNAAAEGNIAGFRLTTRGDLEAIRASSLPVSGPKVTPTEIAFSPDGRTLLVTERDSNDIDAYSVDDSGRARGPTVNASDGAKPFGFGFTPGGVAVVSEAMSSSASSYSVRDAKLTSISASVPNGQAAACWLVVSPDGRYAYTGNAGTGNVSSYRVDRHGALTLAAAVAGSTGPGSHTVDLAFADSGRYFYALANNAGTITAFAVHDGALTELGGVGSLPTSATGLVGW